MEEAASDIFSISSDKEDNKQQANNTINIILHGRFPSEEFIYFFIIYLVFWGWNSSLCCAERSVFK